MAMNTKDSVAKKAAPMFGKGKEKSKDGPAGPGMRPHTGKKDCPCPNCKDKRRG